MGLNEIAIIGLIVAPFIYLMTSRLEDYRRGPNRAERRKKR